MPKLKLAPERRQIIGIRIKLARKDKALTQEKLAEILNISTTALAYYEQGVQVPQVAHLIELATTLNVTTDYLLGLS